MIAVLSFARRHAPARTAHRALVAAGTAGILAALWVATPVQSRADTLLPIGCPGLPASPPDGPAPAPAVFGTCAAIATNSAPSSSLAGSIGQIRTTTAASSGTPARSQAARMATSEQRGPSANAAAVAFSRPDDTRLVLDAASAAKPAIGAFFARPGAARTPQMLLAAVIGLASTLILIVSLLFAISGNYEVQRFVAHRRMYR